MSTENLSGEAREQRLARIRLGIEKDLARIPAPGGAIPDISWTGLFGLACRFADDIYALDAENERLVGEARRVTQLEAALKMTPDRESAVARVTQLEAERDEAYRCNDLAHAELERLERERDETPDDVFTAKLRNSRDTLLGQLNAAEQFLGIRERQFADAVAERDAAVAALTKAEAKINDAAELLTEEVTHLRGSAFPTINAIERRLDRVLGILGAAVGVADQ